MLRLDETLLFIWRSILWGRQILQKCIRWRIGNGGKVQIYKDNWILGPVNFKPISPPFLQPDATITEVINSKNQWNESLIRQHFLKEDANVILKISLPRGSKNDEVL